MTYAQVIVEVAPDHLDRPFDYLVPDEHADQVQVGSRVEVIFNGRKVRGLVVGTSDRTALDARRIRDVRRPLGPHAWVTSQEIEVLEWAGERFAAPLADVVRHALPDRVVDVERRAREAGWFPPDSGERPADPPLPTVDEERWEPYGEAGTGLLDEVGRAASGAYYWRPLPSEDLGARLAELVGRTLAGGRDALVLVGEPRSGAADAVASLHPDLTVDVRGEHGRRSTYRSWLQARCGRARVVVGERGAAFWPLDRLGLTVVVDEANPWFKERRSPRHHAREVILERSRRAGAVALLVGTVPSAEAWRLLAHRRVRPVVPVRALERGAAPIVEVDDGTDPRSRGRLGTLALDALRGAVDAGAFGVVLAARRGEGRALVCRGCGALLECPDCASSLGIRGRTVLCEGCGWQPEGGPRCAYCSGRTFAPLAAGAERIGRELSRTLPGTEVAVLEGYAQPVPDPPAVLVMTRGSAQIEPPGPVRAVVLPDVDGQLRRPDLDAAEDTLRLMMRLAAWVARGRPAEVGDGRRAEGTVVVQTRLPDHPAIRALVAWDPGAFWRAEVSRRGELGFPPVGHALRIDAGAEPARVRGDLSAGLPDEDVLLGPVPEDGRYGFLVKSVDRTATVAALRPLREAWSRDGLDVRIDVDPVDVA